MIGVFRKDELLLCREAAYLNSGIEPTVNTLRVLPAAHTHRYDLSYKSIAAPGPATYDFDT